MVGLLDPRQGDGTYVENRPSRGQLLWGILEPYVMGPVNAWQGLRDADLNTLLYDTGPAGRQAAQNAFDVSSTFTGASSVVPKADDTLNMGFRVFHGSPHDFPPVRLIEMADGTRLYQNMSELADTPQGARIIQEYPMGRFDLSKIGTGEGAQAYGHGLYFAENEDIARSYRDALSPKKVAIGGQMVDSPTFFKAARRSPSVDDNIAMLTKQRENILKEQAQYTSDPELGDLVSELYDQQLRDVDKELAELSQYKGQWFGTRPGGSMYEVEIDADPDAFLDWDKPLSEQPEAVRKGFGSLVDRDLSKETGWAKMSGQQALDAIMERYGSLDWPDNADATLRQQYRTNARSKVSALLADKGIPGIKYLDAGSRVPSAMARKELADWQAQLPVAERELADATAKGDKWLIGRKKAEVKRVQDGIARVSQEAEGTRNYVVFDDNLINIIRKYGIAGLLGGSAAMDAMMSEQQNTQ